MMQVREVMQTPVMTMAAETPLQQALTVLENHQIGLIPVLQERMVVGVLTRRTLHAAVHTLGHAWLSQAQATRIDALLCRNTRQQRVLTLPPDASADDAARLVWEDGAACIVIEQDGELLGVATATDLLDHASGASASVACGDAACPDACEYEVCHRYRVWFRRTLNSVLPNL